MNTNMIDKLELAGKFQEKGKSKDAIAAYEEIICLFPECHSAYLELGKLLKLQGLFEKSLAVFTDAIDLKADSSFAHNSIGEILLKQGYFKKAIRSFKKAAISSFKKAIEMPVSNNPDLYAAYTNMGYCFLKLGEVEKAIEQLNKSVEINSKCSLTHKFLGDAYSLRKVNELAKHHYMISLKIDPGNALAYIAMEGLKCPTETNIEREKNKKVVRLILARYKQEVLSVIPVLRFQDSTGEYPKEQCEDILIIQETSPEIRSIALQWNFTKIISSGFVSDIEKQNGRDIKLILESIRNHINKTVNVVYVSINHEKLPRYILSAYYSSRKITYGHSLGHLLYSPNPMKYVEVDDAYLCLPYEINEGAFSYVNRVVCVEPKYFIETVNEAASRIKFLQEKCEEIKQKLGDRITLVPATYLSEKSVNILPTVQDEIDIHLQLILPNTAPGDSILIKGHMHKSIDYTGDLANELVKNNRQVMVADATLKKIPVELIVTYLNIVKHISIMSTTSISFALLCKCDVVMGWSNNALKLVNGGIVRGGQTQPEFYARRQRAHYWQILQAYRQKFTPIKQSEIKEKFHDFPDFPVCLSYKDAFK
jgi:tetratricopeptide (TPR) repeat protein